MTNSSIIGRGLDQIDTLIGDITDEQWGAATPCAEWTVSDLVDHVVNVPTQFTTMANGQQVDWAAPTPHHDDPAAAFRRHADELLAAVSENDGSVPEGMVAGEFAVHAWDLATALGRDTSDLDPEVADVARAFMSVALTDEQRGNAFGPAQPAHAEANAYERLAAFAGREIPR